MNAARRTDAPPRQAPPPQAAPAQASPPQAAPPQFLQQYPQHAASRPQGPPRPQPIYPYETQRPVPPPQQHPPRPVIRTSRTSPGRRLLGVLTFVALTAISVPVHILAVFFVYVEFESPGDTVTAVLLVTGAFLASFAALFCTGLLAQLVGGFPGRWRARITFAALSGVIALGIAYFAALTLF